MSSSIRPDEPRTVGVRALFFAVHRDLVGVGELEVVLPEGATVQALVAELRARGEPFETLPSQPVVAVNRTYVTGDRVLAAGDEVAFIPPVAGG